MTVVTILLRLYLMNRLLHKFREQKYYPKSDLIVSGTDLSIQLLEKGIVKSDPTRGFKFEYVGLIEVDSILLFIIPKVLDESKCHNNWLEIIIKCLKKYNTNLNELEKTDTYTNYCVDESEKTILSCALNIMNDFAENGLYKKPILISQRNSECSVDWCETIATIDPYFSKGHTFYSDTINDLNTRKEDNLTLIHKWAVIYSNNFLTLLGANSLVLDYQIVDLELLGPPSSIIEVLNKRELITNIDREINLL